MTTCSCVACAPSPTTLIPSSVGVPIPAVKLPSLPPPVEPSSRRYADAPAKLRACSKVLTIVALCSIGGRVQSVRRSEPRPIEHGLEAPVRSLPPDRSRPSRDGRIHFHLGALGHHIAGRAALNRAHVDGGARDVVGQFLQAPECGRPIPRWHRYPSDGRRPHGAARPCATTVKPPTPLRKVLIWPVARVGSSTTVNRLRRASASIRSRDVTLPTSS